MEEGFNRIITQAQVLAEGYEQLEQENRELKSQLENELPVLKDRDWEKVLARKEELENEVGEQYAKLVEYWKEHIFCANDYHQDLHHFLTHGCPNNGRIFKQTPEERESCIYLYSSIQCINLNKTPNPWFESRELSNTKSLTIEEQELILKIRHNKTHEIIIKDGEILIEAREK